MRQQGVMKASMTWSPAAGLNVVSVERGGQAWTITLGSQHMSVCPGCGARSKSRHSTYWRTLRDLSAQGAPVVINARLGRWRCRNQLCDRRIFTERVPGLASPFARRTRPPHRNCPADWLQRGRTTLGATDEAAWDAGQRHDDSGWPEEVCGGSVRNRLLSLLCPCGWCRRLGVAEGPQVQPL